MIDCPSCDGSGYDPREVALFTPVACRHCDGSGRVRPRVPRRWMRGAFAVLAAAAALALLGGWARTVFDDTRPIERVYDYDCADGAYLAEASCAIDQAP